MADTRRMFESDLLAPGAFVALALAGVLIWTFLAYWLHRRSSSTTTGPTTRSAWCSRRWFRSRSRSSSAGSWASSPLPSEAIR